jgi:HK97 family phage prohead protease
MERKYLTFTFDTKSITPDMAESRIMRGYASTYDEDLAGDKIAAGAFATSIKKRFLDPLSQGKSSAIRFLYNHSKPIGVVKSIKEDSKGLYVECYFSKTPKGNEVLTLVMDGALDKMSIGYIVPPSGEYTTKGIRHLTEVDLHEVSIVIFPMNEMTDVMEVRNKTAATKLTTKTTNKEMEGKVLDFELKELRRKLEDVKLEIKAGASISRARAMKLMEASKILQEVLASALDQSTKDNTSDMEDEADGADDEEQEKPVAKPDGKKKKKKPASGGSVVALGMCEGCGEPEEECMCADMSRKGSDSSAPNKEGVNDPIRAENPANPQTSPLYHGKSTTVKRETKESSNQKEEDTTVLGNTSEDNELIAAFLGFGSSLPQI